MVGRGWRRRNDRFISGLVLSSSRDILEITPMSRGSDFGQHESEHRQTRTHFKDVLFADLSLFAAQKLLYLFFEYRQLVFHREFI
ncbi:MAG TPA: hypothetical protein PLN18_01195 [Candidatus Colwellbacteria bacterium]|nr:hypothetical protein [Candidatus Colwellbacteria bacterium]